MKYKIKNWMDNLSPEALKQALYFLLSSKDTQSLCSNRKYIDDQIGEFNRMYQIKEWGKKMVLRQIDIPEDINKKIKFYMFHKGITNKEQAIIELITRGLRKWRKQT